MVLLLSSVCFYSCLAHTNYVDTGGIIWYVNTSIDILIMGERKSLLKLIFTLTLFVTRKLYNRQSLEMKTKAGDAIGEEGTKAGQTA